MARSTNIEFLNTLMEYSKEGAMMQAFIMTACAEKAKRVAEMPLEELKELWGENAFIAPERWHATAKELHAAITARQNEL